MPEENAIHIIVKGMMMMVVDGWLVEYEKPTYYRVCLADTTFARYLQYQAVAKTQCDTT